MPVSTDLSFIMPAAEAVRILLLVQLSEIRNQARLSLEDDLKKSADAVHDLRVAIRRSLAILEGFTPWLEPDWVRKTSKGFRKLLKPLGALRDLDVLAEWAEHLPADAASGKSDFLNKLAGDRSELRGRLPDLLAGKDFQKWLSRRTADLTLPDATIQMTMPAISARGEVRLYRLQDCLPVMLYAAAANLTVYHAAIPDLAGLPEEARQDAAIYREMSQVSMVVLHRLRVAAKSFRYLVEVNLPVLGKEPAGQLIKDFKNFQDLLGNWHDAAVARQYLANYLAKGHSAEPAAIWQDEWQQKLDDLQAAFRQIWPSLSPAWFHTRLSACLDNTEKSQSV